MRPPSIFYTRQRQRPFNERHLKDIEGTRQMMDWFGAAPICFDPRCRRAGRCAGDPRQGRFFLPPCFGHYREELRFFVEVILRYPEAAEEVHPKRGRTVIAAAYGDAAPILERLRRSAHVPGPGAWERDPDAFTDYIIEGDWRNPQGVCRREGESGLILPPGARAGP